MSDEERLSKLEETLRKFNIVSAGSNSSQIVPKFDKPGKDNTSLPIGDRIAALEKIHKDFRIVGAGNVRVEGSLAEGFCINSNCPGDEPDGFPNPVPPPAPPTPPPEGCDDLPSFSMDADFSNGCSVNWSDTLTLTDTPPSIDCSDFSSSPSCSVSVTLGYQLTPHLPSFPNVGYYFVLNVFLVPEHIEYLGTSTPSGTFNYSYSGVSWTISLS